jgi:hypothetical protein
MKDRTRAYAYRQFEMHMERSEIDRPLELNCGELSGYPAPPRPVNTRRLGEGASATL